MLYPAIFALLFAQAQNSGKIVGKVTDALTHRPIHGAHVSCTVGTKFAGSLTEVDGSYVLDDLPAGPVRMTLNLEDYRLIIDIRDEKARFTLGPGETATKDFEMHPLGRIYGKLTDRDSGSPINGHTISALRKEHFPGETSFAGRVSVPTLSGEFEVRNLEPGDYVVAVDSFDEVKFVIGDGGTSHEPAGKFYGQRYYPDVPSREMATLIHLGEGEARNLDLAIQSREPHTISGTVEAPREFAGKPVSVSIRAPDTMGMAKTIDMPTPGPFRVENLAPGSYRLAFTSGKTIDELVPIRANEAAASYQFEITDHDIGDIKVVMERGAGISGEVRMAEEDAPLPERFGVMMVPSSGWFAQLAGGGMVVMGDNAMMSTRVDAGRFHQESVRQGEYWPELVNLPDGYAVAQVLFTGATSRYSTIMLTSPNTPLTFVLTSRPGAIAGVVRDGDQKPAHDAEVLLLPDPVPEKVGPSAVRAAICGDDGGFIFRNLTPGNYRAVVLTGPDQAYEGDIAYLRARAAKADSIEVRAAQSATISLTK